MGLIPRRQATLAPEPPETAPDAEVRLLNQVIDIGVRTAESTQQPAQDRLGPLDDFREGSGVTDAALRSLTYLLAHAHAPCPPGTGNVFMS